MSDLASGRSGPERVQNSCPTGKIGYADRAKARRVAREVNIRKDGAPSSAYRCTHCGQWHIGRKSKTSLSPQRWRKIQQSWGVGGHVR